MGQRLAAEQAELDGAGAAAGLLGLAERMDGGEKLKQMDSPFYFYAAAFIIWLGLSIGVLELITRLSAAKPEPAPKPPAKKSE